MTFQNRTFLLVAATLLIVIGNSNLTLCQTNDVSKNNPYSPSPNANSKQDTTASNAILTENSVAKVSRDMEISRLIAANTNAATKFDNVTSRNPVDIYKIGIGDVLFVNLKNTVAASGYYTVRVNGTIDYPLAGDNVVVTGRTSGELEKSLAAAITLYNFPQIEVKVREFASHKINVTGMVERSGEKSIQREAIPMYVIRANALVDPKATKALIRRSDVSNIETYDLHDPKTDDILIYPGNSVEFTTDGKSSVLTNTGFYYIAGEVNNTGQMELASGITLLQAINASGGAKENPKKAMIRRKSENGTLNVIEHNLRGIKDGKSTDPSLLPGDMIEHVN